MGVTVPRVPEAGRAVPPATVGEETPLGPRNYVWLNLSGEAYQFIPLRTKLETQQEKGPERKPSPAAAAREPVSEPNSPAAPEANR